jgi:hypothetical protein
MSLELAKIYYSIPYKMEAVCSVILIEPHKTGRFSADIIVQLFRAGTYRHVAIHEVAGDSGGCALACSVVLALPTLRSKLE